jgi:hypothetical protein
MLANAKGRVFASQSSVVGRIKCPVTGGVLTDTPSLLANAKFASESDATVGVKVQYTRCLDGCGQHIVSDSAEHIQKCPMCSHSMAEVTDERIAAADVQSDTHNLVVTGADMESASAALRDAYAGVVVVNDPKDSGFMFESNSAVKYNAFTGKRVTDAEISENCVSLSGAMPTESVKVHMLSCSGDCAQPVTLSTTPDAVYCTHCRSPLVDPAAVEGLRQSMSSSDDGDDDEDDEDDFDLDDDTFGDDLDDEDMESDSASGDDDDEDDEDEDDFDFEDDEEDDEDDEMSDDFDDDDSLMEDDGDDEEDDDEDMESDSASKKKKAKAKHKKKVKAKKIAKKSSSVKSSKADFDKVFADEDDKSRKSLWMKYLQACRKKAQTAEEFAEAQGIESASAKSCSCGKASCSKCSESGDDEDDSFIDEDDLDELDFDDGDEEDEDLESDSKTSVKVNMLEALSSAGVELNASDIQLSFVEASGKQPARWFAYHNGTPIAQASQASMSSAVGEESAHAMFNSPRVPRAFAHVASEKGVSAAIDELGFSSMSMDVDVSNVMQARAQAEADQKVANVTAEVESHCDEYRDRMTAALSTALVGIQRGFWRNENNPVISQLVTSLSSAGFANPEPLVAQAFANQGESLFKTVMAKALELMQKPVEVQNELAASISGMGAVVGADANVEDRLANVGNVVQGQPVVTQQIESQSSAARVDFSERARMQLRRINGLA